MSNKTIGLTISAALVAAFFYLGNPEGPDTVVRRANTGPSDSTSKLSPDIDHSKTRDGARASKTAGELVSLFKPHLAVPSDDFDEADNFGDRIQIIGEFEDPDSDVDDMFELRQQIIGEPIDVDLELDSVEASQIALIEDPDAQPGDAELAVQIIGDEEDIDNFLSVDDETLQIIGQPEIAPDLQ